MSDRGPRWALTSHHWARSLITTAGVFSIVSVMGLMYVSGGSPARETLFTQLLINASIVIGMQIYIGSTGILSFGHVGFGGIAGYTFAILAVGTEWKARLLPNAPFGVADVELAPVAAIGIAVLVSVGAGAVVGLGLMRSGSASGALAATVITLALLFGVHEVAINWTDLTGGNRGGLSFRPGTALTTRGPAYLVFGSALFVATAFSSSRSGRLARAVREDELAARSSGIDPRGHQMVALLISIGVVAVGSSLRVWVSGTISPERFFIDFTLLTLTMLVVGGRNSVTGAVLGTVLITIVTETTRQLAAEDFEGAAGVIFRPGLSGLVLGASMLGFMLFRSKGLLEDRELADFIPRSSALAIRPERTSIQDGRLAATGVSVAYGGLSVLGQAHMRVRSGQIVGLIGPNGAGKTTFLNALSGLAPAVGVVELNDIDVLGKSPHQLARLGIARTFQNLRLLPALTSVENVEVAALAAGRRAEEARSAAAWALELVELTDKSRVRARALPYGDAKRLELARAAVQRPLFVLLDEPTSGFDEVETLEVQRHVRQLVDTLGCGVVIVDHDLSFVTQICDVVYCLDQGSVASFADGERIAEQPAVRKAYIGVE